MDGAGVERTKLTSAPAPFATVVIASPVKASGSRRLSIRQAVAGVAAGWRAHRDPEAEPGVGGGVEHAGRARIVRTTRERRRGDEPSLGAGHQERLTGVNLVVHQLVEAGLAGVVERRRVGAEAVGPLEEQSSVVPVPAVPPSGLRAQKGDTVVAVSKSTHSRPARQSLLTPHRMRQRAPVTVPG